ncbi:MAG: hypothetical protein KDC39_11320 [Actinobacteria bacterium]|nr:hypothetical protein [Actinomycetota bacterium]
MSQVPTSEPQYQPQRTAWTGWIVLAAVFMLIVGALEIIYGLVAIFNHDWVLWNSDHLLLLDTSSWGWVSLIWGLIVFFVGVGLFSGNFIARVLGVIAVAISLISHFLWLPAYPFWSMIIIIIDIFIIWAIIAHGREMKLP